MSPHNGLDILSGILPISLHLWVLYEHSLLRLSKLTHNHVLILSISKTSFANIPIPIILLHMERPSLISLFHIAVMPFFILRQPRSMTNSYLRMSLSPQGYVSKIYFPFKSFTILITYPIPLMSSRCG